MRLKDAKIGFLGGCFRVLQTLFLGGRYSGGCANATPPATSTRANALGIQPFRLDTFGATAHNNYQLTQHIAQKSTIMWNSVPNPCKSVLKNDAAQPLK